MNKNEIAIARVNSLLGPHQITAMGIGMAGANHATRLEEWEEHLCGVVWVSSEQRALAKANDFVWYVDIMVALVGKKEDRPPETRNLPGKIVIYTHDPALLFDSLMGDLFHQWTQESRFKTAQKWYNPGVYVKPEAKSKTQPKKYNTDAGTK